MKENWLVDTGRTYHGQPPDKSRMACMHESEWALLAGTLGRFVRAVAATCASDDLRLTEQMSNRQY
jgi:hypothetical protein